MKRIADKNLFAHHAVNCCHGFRNIRFKKRNFINYFNKLSFNQSNFVLKMDGLVDLFVGHYLNNFSTNNYPDTEYGDNFYEQKVSNTKDGHNIFAYLDSDKNAIFRNLKKVRVGSIFCTKNHAEQLLLVSKQEMTITNDDVLYSSLQPCSDCSQKITEFRTSNKQIVKVLWLMEEAKTEKLQKILKNGTDDTITFGGLGEIKNDQHSDHILGKTLHKSRLLSVFVHKYFFDKKMTSAKFLSTNMAYNVFFKYKTDDFQSFAISVEDVYKTTMDLQSEILKSKKSGENFESLKNQTIDFLKKVYSL
jgi:cytidine deaminase